MEYGRLDRWLRRLRGTATFVYLAALCLGVAVLVIGLIPKSPVILPLPTEMLTGTGGVGGIAHGVVVDSTGEIVFRVSDASLGQRMLYVATVLPALLLVAEIGRRMASLLRAAYETDPFTAQTASALNTVAKITAFGGVGVWALGACARWALSATMLTSGAAARPHDVPLGWLAVGLIFAAFALLVSRGVGMRAELDTVI